jgi:thioredoxin-dependent peroxiredoxin
MVELRKRPARDPAPAPAAKRASSKSNVKSKAKAVVDKVKGTSVGGKAEPPPTTSAETTGGKGVAGTEVAGDVKGDVDEKAGGKAVGNEGAEGGSSKLSKDSMGTKIALEGFGGTVSTHDGKEVSLKSLLDEGKKGVVVFTYPKASTPGCEFSFPLLRLSASVAGTLCLRLLSALPQQMLSFRFFRPYETMLFESEIEAACVEH